MTENEDEGEAREAEGVGQAVSFLKVTPPRPATACNLLPAPLP